MKLNIFKTVRQSLLVAGLIAAGGNVFAAAVSDLLIAYDASHPSAVGGEDNAQVLAANAVAGCNAINDRSGTGARVRIVGYHQAAQNLYQTTSKGGFVNWMANYDSHMTDVVDAGNARGADLVAWLCVSTADGAAAVAQQPGRYSAFDPGQFWSAVVAHELGGHNYGCDHRGGKGDLASPKTVLMHNYCTGGGSTPPYFFSNPNIWLNGERLQGVGSCLGAAVNSGDNAYLISTTAQGRADAYGRVVTAPNLGNVVLRWCFTNAAASAPASTTNYDLISGAPAIVRGVGATYTGKALRLPGGTTGNTAANSIAAYIDLPNGIISTRTNLTIEIWATPLSAPNWGRIMDFGRTTEAGNGAAGEWTGLPGTPAPGTTSSSDNIMLSASIGTDINQQRFEAKLNGSAVTLDAGLATTAGVQHHYAITFTDNLSGGRWQWFRDGDAVAYLDVTYHLSSIEDVNNWLGRSLWSGDSMANVEYAEVRISDVAMSRDQIAANCALGPNRNAAIVMMNADDAIGAASFAAAGNWSDGLAPSAGKTYETYRFRLRTPADATSRTFAGQALTLSGGGITWKGTASSLLTVNNLTASGESEFINAGSGTWTLAGSMAIKSDEAMIRAANGPITISANLSGSGNLLCVNNTVTFSGNNSAYSGKITAGDGRFSGILIDSETRLGANPAAFTADQLTLNRGILYNTGSVTIDDANRGIRVGASAALFNVTAGTTVTLAVPLSGTSSGGSLVSAPIYPNPVSGILIKENSGTLALTHPNNSHAGEVIISGGNLTLSGNGRLNNGDQAMPVVNNATFTINTTTNQTISGVISGTGALVKSSTGTLTLTAANSYSGATTVSGGRLLVNGSLANGAVAVNGTGTLGGNGTMSGVITVQSGGTLSPGSSIGVLNASNNVTLQSGSTTFMEISKTPKTNDQLRVTGTLTFGGTLVVTNLAGTFVAGDSVRLFQAGTFAGTFSSNSLPALSPGLAWSTANLVNGVLNVVRTAPTNLMWSVNGTSLNLSWPSEYIGWRLQVQTNALAAGLGNNWLNVAGATATNWLTFPMNGFNGGVFYRLTFP